VGVPVVLLVEDNVRHLSSFLPVIYTELIDQSRRLVGEGVNLSHKLVRMRARPRILHAENFEKAWEIVERFRPHLLGLISDVEFPRGGRIDRDAGFALARAVRERAPDMPILLQSSREEFAAGAAAVGAAFVRKYSDTLLAELRRFMSEQFAFGDFVFRMPDGRAIARASDLRTLEEQLRTVPPESIAYHGERNHFSMWFVARTEFSLARRLRPRKVSDFPTLEHLRRDIVRAIAEYRREQGEVLMADFDRRTFDPASRFFARIGGGSIGGKARGLAFVRFLLHYHGLVHRFPGIRIGVPQAVVLATDLFDRFLDANDLRDFALGCDDEQQLRERFEKARLPADLVQDLESLLSGVRWPLAVRSSSLLEDSQYQPFTGVYDTYMLPNDEPGLQPRVRALCSAIKSVYASTFAQRAKAYLRATPYRLEEEKMAVVIQRVVGSRHGDRYYPHFAGVADSHNFYPSAPSTSDDGVAAVALGLGRTVVEGEPCLSFCPRFPLNIPHFSSVDDVLANSQRTFWALEMRPEGTVAASSGEASAQQPVQRHNLETAEADGMLDALVSTWSADNQAIYDGLSRPGVRLVTFAPILKHGLLPLGEILTLLLDLGRRGMNRHAEIEFAVRMSPGGDEPHEFAFLQIRPLVLNQEGDVPDVRDVPSESLLVKSPRVLGHGVISDLVDAVVVDFHRYDRSRGLEAAAQVGRLNARLAAEGRRYLLIGVGRWGSADGWLGIPVSWDQISNARVIVEAGFRDLRVTPSQGSHFFQNLASFQVGYFTVNADAGEGFVDWEWLASQPTDGEELVRHLSFEQPLTVRMDGRRGVGHILKPEAATVEPSGSASS
jgi:CheY-like chemotaxis protein